MRRGTWPQRIRKWPDYLPKEAGPPGSLNEARGESRAAGRKAY